jgi:hypothetical protein
VVAAEHLGDLVLVLASRQLIHPAQKDLLASHLRPVREHDQIRHFQELAELVQMVALEAEEQIRVAAREIIGVGRLYASISGGFTTCAR